MRFLLLTLALLAAAVAPLRAQQSPARAQTQALFVEALTRAFLDDHEGAIARYREVLEQEPGQPTVLSALAESYAAAGQPALAQETADEAARRSPDNAHFARVAAAIAASRGDASGAARRYEALLERHPTDLLATQALADLHARRGAYADAARLLETLPPTAEALTQLLDLYEKLDNDGAFTRTFERLAALQPPDAAVLARLGRHHLRHDRADAAREAFEAALRRDAAHPEARAALAAMGGTLPEAAPSPGLAAYAAGDFRVAAGLLKAALAADARSADAWAQAAMALLEAGQNAEAERVIEDGRLIFFDHPTLLVAAAYAALAAGDATAAGARVSEARTALSPAAPDHALYTAALDVAAAYAAARALPAPPAADVLTALRARALVPAPGGALGQTLGAW